VAHAAVEWALRHMPAEADRAQLGWANIALGNLLLEMTTDLPAAHDAVTAALSGMRDGHDLAGEGNALIVLAQVLRRQGQTEQAKMHYRQAAEILTEVDDPMSLCVVEDALARIHLLGGDLATARKHAAKALGLAESLYYPLGLKFALSTMGEIQLRVGDHVGARQTLRSAVEVARPMSGTALANVLNLLGQAEAALGNVQAARSAGQESFELYHAMNRPEADSVRTWLENLNG
jgi:tetratricopeptide (TPR) repeat protein